MALSAKEIKVRIKTAKTVMRESKKHLNNMMAGVIKGDIHTSGALMRAELSKFTKAETELTKLSAKL